MQTVYISKSFTCSSSFCALFSQSEKISSVSVTLFYISHIDLFDTSVSLLDIFFQYNVQKREMSMAFVTLKSLASL